MFVNHPGEDKPAGHEAKPAKWGDRTKQARSVEGEYVDTAGEHKNSRSEQDADFSKRFGSTRSKLKANNANQNQCETVVAHVLRRSLKSAQFFFSEDVF